MWLGAWLGDIFELKEFAYGYTEVPTQLIDGLKLDPLRSLVIEESQQVPMKTRCSGYVCDAHFSLAHEARQMTVNHERAEIVI